MLICLPHDLKQIYAFYCRNYGNIKFDDLLTLGYEEFSMKLNSIPKSEPLYDIIKARAINLESIKDKEERKYWRELKSANRIPDIYLPTEVIRNELKTQISKGGNINGKFN